MRAVEPVESHPLLRVTGRLYVAELGTAAPCMDVADGRFALDWPSPWTPAGAVYVKPIEFDAGFGRNCQVYVPTGVDADAWPQRFAVWIPAGEHKAVRWDGAYQIVMT